MKIKTSPFNFTDSGVRSGAENMEIDRSALERIIRAENSSPTVRFFQWDKPTITFGYLLDPIRVQSWELSQQGIPLVQRPTGGGVVLHHPSELSLSVLWPRDSKIFPNKPRDCYKAIHAILKIGLENFLGPITTSLYTKPLGNCASDSSSLSPQKNLPVCFNEPVCNDVMLDGKKIIGGALRITKQALLYQGAIQLPKKWSNEVSQLTPLKSALTAAFIHAS